MIIKEEEEVEEDGTTNNDGEMKWATAAMIAD